MSVPSLSPPGRLARVRAGLLLAALLGLHCDPPPVAATADARQNQELSRIEGEVVVLGPVRGNAIILLYDETRPPPPQGTGRPVSFTVIPRERLFGAADSTSGGPFTAPYAFSLVAPGRYTVRGFIDAETCRQINNVLSCHGPDFIPWYNVTGEPNAGDLAGAALDLTSPLSPPPLRVLEIAKVEGRLTAPTGVNVLFSASTPLYSDRPAFSIDGSMRFERTSGAKYLELKPLQYDRGVVHEWPASMVVRFADENGDGQPEDLNQDTLLDLWPRVVVRKLADGAGLSDAQKLADENDLDRNGLLDPRGVEYPRQDGSGPDGQSDLVVLPAAVDPTPIAALRKADGTWRMDAVPVSSLRVIVFPRAYDARDPRSPQALQTMPSGRYAINLIQFTGQTWRVPNELSPQVAPGLDLPATAPGQAFVIEVP